MRLIAIFICTLAVGVTAATIHVPADQPTLQAGIDAATNGDTVLAAAGTYSGTGNQAITFSGKGILLKGESGATSTILRTTDTVRTLIFNAGEDTLTIIDGFTIQGATGTSAGSCGGGILITSASPQVRNCIVTNCRGIDGGGIVVGGNSLPRFVSCTINSNTATEYGGGVFVGWESAASFDSCTFASNTAAISGGGICTEPCTRLSVANSVLSRNYAPQGGAMAVRNASLWLTGSIIYNNIADSCAGVLVNTSGRAAPETLSVSRCTFACNYSAKIFADGVAIRRLPEVPILMPWEISYSITYNIFAFNSCAGIGLYDEDINPVISFNDIWTVASGPRYAGYLPDQTGTNGNFSADPLFCSVADTGFMLDQTSPCAAMRDGGSLVGAKDVGCDMYGGTPPHRDTVYPWGITGLQDTPSSITDPYDTCAQDYVDQARPWDTLYWPSSFYPEYLHLFITKPLYILGAGARSTTLTCYGYQDQIGKTLDFTSFAYVRGMTISGNGCCNRYGIEMIVCEMSSPMITDCRILGGWSMVESGGVSVVTDAASSPLIRNSRFLYPERQCFWGAYGQMKIVASHNSWDLSDSAAIANVIGNNFETPVAILFMPFLVQDPTPVDDPPPSSLPSEFSLAQNFPNPFNPSTTIAYSLPSRSNVTLDIFNILGQRVRTLVDGPQPAGNHQIIWDGKDDSDHAVASGIYLYRLKADDYVESMKMLLLK